MNQVNPRMITLARESRQFTQSALANALETVTQGTLSKIEHGQIVPSDEVLTDLSEFLDYPVELFFEVEPFRHLPSSFYRKRVSVAAKVLDAITARMNLLRLQIRKFLRSAEIPEVSFARVDLKELRGNVESVARELRIKWHLPPGPVENVTSTLEDAGVLIVKFDFGTNKVDGLSVYDPTDNLAPLILINHSLPGDRARFTLCHEFAHILFHHHLPALTEEGNIEREADKFAAEFLIPTKDIKPYLHRPTLKKLAALKPHWKVSIQALIRKAFSVGLLTERQRRYMMMQMSKLGYRTNEPFPIPSEEPRLIHELVRFHLDDLDYSEDDLAHTVRLNGTDFRQQYLGERRTPYLRVIKSPTTRQPKTG